MNHISGPSLYGTLWLAVLVLATDCIGTGVTPEAEPDRDPGPITEFPANVGYLRASHPSGGRLTIFNGEWVVIQDGLAADAFSHTDTDVADRGGHAYRVQAYNTGGDGPWSEEASATHTSVPAVPESVNAVVPVTGVVPLLDQPQRSRGTVASRPVSGGPLDQDHVEVGLLVPTAPAPGAVQE